MDVLNVLDKLDEIEILYEPIYSADEHSVAAYEVLGQLDENISLQMFSQSEEVPIEMRIEIEQLVIRQAVQKAKAEMTDVDLFIPCNPNLLMVDFGESYFELLKGLLSEELLPQIVLVMNASDFNGNMDQLHHVIKYIKTYGVKIALDDIGPHSNLNNILLLEPFVLKMPVGQLDYNHWSTQNHVFSTLRALTMKIGASLLVSDISTAYELQHGWKSGARFYKGAYLEKPLQQFIARDTLKSRFHNECVEFIAIEKRLLEEKHEAIKMLERKIVQAVEQVEPTSNQIDRLLQLAEKLHPFIFRLYICDGEGFQTTPNIMFLNGKWTVQQHALHKNWSWRPYFLQNLIKMRYEGESKLSETYSDIETSELTRTYSMPLPKNEYLFVDIAYDYLYENNIVS